MADDKKKKGTATSTEGRIARVAAKVGKAILPSGKRPPPSLGERAIKALKDKMKEKKGKKVKSGKLGSGAAQKAKNESKKAAARRAKRFDEILAKGRESMGIKK